MSELPRTEGFSTPSHPGPRWFRELGSGWSTVFLVGAVATVSQLVAASLAHTPLLADARTWSSGGIVALIAGPLIGKLAKPWEKFKKWIWLPLVTVSVLSFWVVGASNSYDVEVVTQEARAATMSLQPTGLFDVVTTDDRICEPGDDYLFCLNGHVSSYNAACANQPLSRFGSMTCVKMSDFIEQTRHTYEGCGYGCVATGEIGNWGWPHLMLEAETRMMSNNDALPRLTHRERCFFDLGVLQVGNCSPQHR